MEQRIIRCFDAEMRAGDTEDMTVKGYAAVFEREAKIGSGYWGFREKILKGAFAGADMSNVYFNFNHDNNIILAGTKNNSLILGLDDKGLKQNSRFIDTSDGVKIYKLIKAGLVNRMSFAFTVKTERWTYSDNPDILDLREIVEIEKLYDVSAVTFPAYEDATLMVRSNDFSQRQKQLYERQIQKLIQILQGEKI